MFQATSTQNLTVKGVDVTVHGLRHWECPECSAQVETPDQIDFNAVLVREAFLRERAAHKRQRGLLTGTEILAFRNRFGVTQKLAAQLFGGGPTAFAKYEAEDVVHNASMDRLLRLCIENPSDILTLAQQHEISLPVSVVAKISEDAEEKFRDTLERVAEKIHKLRVEHAADYREAAKTLADAKPALLSPNSSANDSCFKRYAGTVRPVPQNTSWAGELETA